jgi:hypothetical protein
MTAIMHAMMKIFLRLHGRESEGKQKKQKDKKKTCSSGNLPPAKRVK